MSDTEMDAESAPPVFLTSFFSNWQSPPDHRPYVTLTFAQSIDSKIAGAGGRQLLLSGKESMVMTHWLRTIHDAILIGIGTALNDDPQLNVRHLPVPPDTDPDTLYPLPRPIIIDTHLRLPLTGKLLRNYKAATGRAPWVVCYQSESEETRVRAKALSDAGARVIAIPSSHPKEGRSSGIHLPSILNILRAEGIKSLMVEGGARIIESFLSEKDTKVVDKLIITVAPILVGASGVGYTVPAPDVDFETGKLKETFVHVKSEAFGRDTVMAFDAVVYTPI